MLTPEDVFKTDGHVDRFEDWICRDYGTGEYIRAHHLVKAVLEARLREDVGHGQQSDAVSHDRQPNFSRILHSPMPDNRISTLYEDVLSQVGAIVAQSHSRG